MPIFYPYYFIIGIIIKHLNVILCNSLLNHSVVDQKENVLLLETDVHNQNIKPQNDKFAWELIILLLTKTSPVTHINA